MVEFCTRERQGGMAGLTTQLGLEVLRSFDDICLGQATAAHMTTRTIFWSTFKDSVDVARLASRIGMQSR